MPEARNDTQVTIPVIVYVRLLPGGRVLAGLMPRTLGGAALTVTEPLGMAPHHATLSRPQIWDGSDADGFRRQLQAAGFHKERREKVGQEAWALLEKQVGSLA